MNERVLLDCAQRAIAECKLIAQMSEEPNCIKRLFLTSPVRDVHGLLRKRMESLGMKVRTDAVGNLRGLWRPASAHGKRLILGSHIDTVPNAGAYDGVLGVVLAIELVEIAQELKLLLPIEVIAFSEEEGVRFGVPFIGSRAVEGRFDSALLALKDADGVTLDKAIRTFGLDPGQIHEEALDADVLGFVEVHIEQGPILEAESLSVGAVTGIVGQSRLTLEFRGHANHSGTTPMNLRRDSLTGAAEFISAVESRARSAEGLIATVGKINVEPNASNVVPGAAILSMDVRHADDHSRNAAVETLLAQAQAIAGKRGLALKWTQQMDQAAVPMDERLTAYLIDAIAAAGLPEKHMTSGAGHDAMVMAACVPAAMLFLRSPGGISHHPGETVREEDVEAALKVGSKFLERLAAEVR
jgi:allantoate deiminase